MPVSRLSIHVSPSCFRADQKLAWPWVIFVPASGARRTRLTASYALTNGRNRHWQGPSCVMGRLSIGCSCHRPVSKLNQLVSGQSTADSLAGTSTRPRHGPADRRSPVMARLDRAIWSGIGAMSADSFRQVFIQHRAAIGGPDRPCHDGAAAVARERKSAQGTRSRRDVCHASVVTEVALDGSGDGRGRNVRRSRPERLRACRMFSPAAISTRVA